MVGGTITREPTAGLFVTMLVSVAGTGLTVEVIFSMA